MKLNKLFAMGVVMAFVAAPAMAHNTNQTTKNLGVIQPGDSVVVTASCDAKQHLTGGGYDTNMDANQNGPLRVTKSYPAGNAWNVEFTNTSEAPTHSKPGHRVTVYAVCTQHTYRQ